MTEWGDIGSSSILTFTRMTDLLEREGNSDNGMIGAKVECFHILRSQPCFWVLRPLISDLVCLPSTNCLLCYPICTTLTSTRSYVLGIGGFEAEFSYIASYLTP